MATEPAASLLPGASATLARFAAGLRFEDIPPAVVVALKRSVLDSLGCCLFGATLPWTARVREMVQAEGCAPVATLFGTGHQTSPANAVLVNATAGHAFELDDIHRESVLHPGSIAVPVALALAERAGQRGQAFSGADLLAAMAAGYEVGTRVGNAATLSLFYRGFHPQGTSGVFVAAATAGRALGLDGDAMLHALGSAGSQAGGLMAAQEGAMVKRFHSGRAAQSGVYAALLAETGFTGITDVLEAGYGGYLSTYAETPNALRLTDGLGSVWEAGKVGYKPHAAVTSIHAALDALRQLMQANGLAAGDIARLDVGVSRMTHLHCAWPYRAQGVTAAQMNLYYGLAVMATDGAAFVDQYREQRLADPALLALIGRIHAVVDPRIEAMGPAFRHAARITLTTTDGRHVEAEVLHRRGSPENPLDDAEVAAKFRALVAGCLPAPACERIVEQVRGLEYAADLRELMALLGAAPTYREPIRERLDPTPATAFPPART